MGIDYSIALECDVKCEFGRGDAVQGAAVMTERLKSRCRAKGLAAMVKRQGDDPTDVSVMLLLPERTGSVVQKMVTIAEMEAEGKELDERGTACEGCPANSLGEPFGCFGFTRYPVLAGAEDWLLDRLQPAGTIGAKLCLDFMNDFGVRGNTTRRMRKRRLIENAEGRKMALDGGAPDDGTVSADQLFETILFTGDALTPGHCFEILIWFGAIKIDGRVPERPEDLPQIQKAAEMKTREEKESRTELELGPEPAAEEAEAFRGLMKAFYLAWILGVELTMSA